MPGHSLDALILTTLHNAAEVEPTAEVALSILTAAELNMHEVSEFKTLANDACHLVYHVLTFIEQMKEQDITLPLDIENSVKDLFEILKEIELFANKPQSYSFSIPFRVSIFYSDGSRILGYRQTLCHFWARFVGLQSNIIIRSAIALIAQRQDAILDALRQESTARPTPQPHIIVTGHIDTLNSTIIHDSGNTSTTTTSSFMNTNSGNLAAA